MNTKQLVAFATIISIVVASTALALTPKQVALAIGKNYIVNFASKKKGDDKTIKSGNENNKPGRFDRFQNWFGESKKNKALTVFGVLGGTALLATAGNGLACYLGYTDTFVPGVIFSKTGELCKSAWNKVPSKEKLKFWKSAPEVTEVNTPKVEVAPEVTVETSNSSFNG